MSQTSDSAALYQFTVGSLPRRSDNPEAILHFEHELGLLKAALLYADRVKLCSVGASLMSALADLRNMDVKGKSNIVRQAMAHIPGATHEKLERTYRILDAASGARRGSSRRGVTGPNLFEAKRLIETDWQPIKYQGRRTV